MLNAEFYQDCYKWYRKYILQGGIFLAQKRQPLRKCTGCGEMKEKRELIRVVKAPDTKDENGNVISKGEISLDLTGKKSGRGAYVCPDCKCFEKARKARRFERAFSCKIPDEVYIQLEESLKESS